MSMKDQKKAKEIAEQRMAMILSMGIPSFLIKYCNASAPAYYDSIWFVTRTRHRPEQPAQSNLYNKRAEDCLQLGPVKIYAQNYLQAPAE